MNHAPHGRLADPEIVDRLQHQLAEFLSDIKAPIPEGASAMISLLVAMCLHQENPFGALSSVTLALHNGVMENMNAQGANAQSDEGAS